MEGDGDARRRALSAPLSSFRAMSPRVAVVGHVEWAEFARVERVPRPGEIAHVLEDWEDPGGGGAVSVAQLAKLAGRADFFTALADDEMGRASAARLERMGVVVHAARRPAPQRRAFVYLDGDGERTITVIGARIVPVGADPLPWASLAEVDGVYFTGGDADALRAARAARTLVATPRAAAVLREAGIHLDVLVRSASDPGEAFDVSQLPHPPTYVVATHGARGGRWTGAEGRTGTWAAAELPGPVADAYGCGDSFAAGVTYGLAAGWPIERALELAARCGAYCLTGRGPYAAQLTEAG
jgi:ribokinase